LVSDDGNIGNSVFRFVIKKSGSNPLKRSKYWCLGFLSSHLNVHLKMEYLEQSVENLSQDERSEFRAFLQKQKLKRRDLQLFDLLVSPARPSSREMAEKLYDPINLNAYHSLRKRLMSQLFTFVVSKRLQADATQASSVMGMISMGKFMLEKQAGEVAAYFFEKAEQTASKNDQTELLANVYQIQIAHSHELHVDLDDVIQKWLKNNERQLATQKLDIAYALIRQKLAEVRKQGTTLDPEEIIEAVFRDFQITGEVANNAAYMYKIVAMTRSAIISTKDYYRLEPFIIRIYTRMEAKGSFGKRDAHYQLGFQYMIAHVLYRNRKFVEALPWIAAMENVLPFQSFRSSQHYPKYMALRAAVASYSGKNLEAIELMKNVLQSKHARIPLSEKLNMQLNLAVYYFQSSDFKRAQKAMLEIAHSDKWIEEKMGKEWRFKKNMIELIIQCELGNEDLALSRIRSVEKYFSAFLSHPVYQRAKLFLKFIRRMISNPELVATPAFAEEVKEARLGWPGEKEDIQAITFFCWMKSKMLRRDYYEVLLEAMQRG
jgi:hypothetical protein